MTIATMIATVWTRVNSSEKSTAAMMVGGWANLSKLGHTPGATFPPDAAEESASEPALGVRKFTSGEAPSTPSRANWEPFPGATGHKPGSAGDRSGRADPYGSIAYPAS